MGWNDFILLDLLISVNRIFKCSQRWCTMEPRVGELYFLLRQSWIVSQWLLRQYRVVCSGWVKVNKQVI